jgi:hypothetical protein
MKSAVNSFALLAVVLLLPSAAAFGGECKPVHARIGPATYLDPCEYSGIEFFYCIDTPLRGTFRGTWHYYAEEDNGVLPEPGDPYSPFIAGWALGLIETNKGEVFLQDNYLWNLNAISADHVPFVSAINITGGSGKYEGASGWLGVIADDSGNWRGFMKGVICTP